MKNNLKLQFFFVLFFILVFNFAVVAAAEDDKSIGEKNESIKNFFSDKLNTTAKLLGIKDPESGDKFLGFEIASFSFGKYFVVGLLAGLMLWLFYITIIKVYWRIKHYQEFKKPLKIIKGQWIEMVAGRLWKVVVIAVVYATIMQIPLLNRIIQVITLEIFYEDIWSKALVIALEIGFLPAIVEYYVKARYEIKQQKKVQRAAMVGASAPKKS